MSDDRKDQKDQPMVMHGRYELHFPVDLPHDNRCVGEGFTQ